MMDINAILNPILNKKAQSLIEGGMSPESSEFRVEMDSASKTVDRILRDRMRQTLYARLRDKGVDGVVPSEDETAPLMSGDDKIEGYVDLNIDRVMSGRNAIEWDEFIANDRGSTVTFFEDMASRIYSGVEGLVGELSEGIVSQAKFFSTTPFARGVGGGLGAAAMEAITSIPEAREQFELGTREVGTAAKEAFRTVAGSFDGNPAYNPFIEYLSGSDVDAPETPSQRLGTSSPTAAYMGQIAGDAIASAPLSIPPMLARDPLTRAALTAPFYALGYRGAEKERWDAYFVGKARAQALGLPAPEMPTESELKTAGVIGGVAEYGSEYVFDALQLGVLRPAGKWFGSTSSGALGQGVSRLNKNLGELLESTSRLRGPMAIPKIAAKIGFAGVTEGLEETVPSMGKEIIDALGITPEEFKSQFWSDETLRNFLVGTVAGTGLGGAAGAVSYAAGTPERRAFKRAVGEALPTITAELDEASKADAERNFAQNVTYSRGTSMVMHQSDEVDVGARNAIAVNERDLDATVNRDVADHMRRLGIRRVYKKNGVVYFGRAADATQIVDAVKNGNSEYINGHVNMASGQIMAGAIVVRDGNGVIVDVKPYSDADSRPISALAAHAGSRGLTVEDVSADRLHTISDQIQRQVDADLARSGIEGQGTAPQVKGDTKKGMSVLKKSIRTLSIGRGPKGARYNPMEQFLSPEEVGGATNGDVSVSIVLDRVADDQLSDGERKVKTTTGVTPTVLDGKMVFSIKQKDGSVKTIEKPIPKDGAYVGQNNPDGVFLIRENGTALNARSALMLMIHELRHRVTSRSRAGGQFLGKLLMLDPVYAMRGGAAYMRESDARNAYKTDAQIVLDYAAMASAAREVLADPSSTEAQRASARRDIREVRAFAEESVATTANRSIGQTAQLAAEWDGIYKNTQGMSLRKFAAFMSSKLVDHGFVGPEAKQAISELRQRLSGANDRQLRIDEAYRTSVERAYREQMREAMRREAERKAKTTPAQPSTAQQVAPQQAAPQQPAQPQVAPQQQPAQPQAPFVPANPNQAPPAGVDASGQPVDANGMPFFSNRAAAGLAAATGGVGEGEEDNTPQGIMLRAVNMLQQVIPMLTQTQAQVAGVRPSSVPSSRGLPAPVPQERGGPTVESIEVPAEPMFADSIAVEDIATIDSSQYPQEVKDLIARIAQPEDGGARFSIRKVADADLTEGQRQFFRDSVVRDEDGYLIPLLHGTVNEFPSFQPSRYGKFGGGVYLTEDQNVANEFNESSYGMSGGRTIPLYANVKNPVYLNYRDTSTYEPLKSAMRSWIADPINELYAREKARMVDSEIESLKQGDANAAENIRDLIGADSRQSFLKSLGYDSVVQFSEDGRTLNELVVFDPNEAKGVFNDKPTRDIGIMASRREMKRGADAIVNRINMERSFGRLSEDDARYATDLVRRIGDVGETALSIVEPLSKRIPSLGISTVGFWEPLEQAIGVSTKAIKSGDFKRVFTHELWHALSPYLNDDVVRSLDRGYLRARDAFIRKYDVDPRDFHSDKSAFLSDVAKKDIPIDEWYPLVDLDEYLAAGATNATRERIALESEIINAKGEVARLFSFMRLMYRNALTSIGQVFDRRTADAVARDFMRGTPSMRRGGPLRIEDVTAVMDQRGMEISAADQRAEREANVSGTVGGMTEFGPMFSRRGEQAVAASTPTGEAMAIEPKEALDEQRTGDGGGREEGGSLAPLEGAPRYKGAAGPDPRLVAVAEQYAKDNGIPLRRQSRYAEVDEQRARRIAMAYEAMPHAPSNPEVAEAYKNLIDQTLAQYKALESAGYQFYFFDETNDPYQGNPVNAMRDLRQNQRMAVFATEAGFGTAPLDVADNPLLADTGMQWGFGSPDGPKKRVLANDLFRAVHDAFGHGLEGAGFRARGEENAWQAHVRLFTGSAIGALTSETRGQNSWLNYGPQGEKNRTAKVEDTVFADQKSGLMPEWTWTEGRLDLEEEPRFSRRRIELHAKQPTANLSPFDAANVNWRPPKTKDGKYLGLPEWVKTPKDLRKMREELYDRVIEGVKGRYWYEKSGEAVLRFVQNNIVDAEKFIQLLAIYSPNSNVWVNTLQAVRAYTHWKTGKPESTFKVGSEVGDGKAKAVLYRNSPWEGRKTNSFYLNLMSFIVNKYPSQVSSLNLTPDMMEAMKATMDVWMARAFGYRNEQFGDGKGSDKYSVSENELRRLTARLNANLAPNEDPWTPHQVQAAIWSAMKSRYEIPEVKDATNADAEAQGLLDDAVNDKGKPIKVYAKDAARRAQHLANWRRHAMSVDTYVAEQVSNEMARDFSDDMNRMVQTITWEAIPSPSTNAPILSADPDVQAEFTTEVRNLVIENGDVDTLARAIGVPMHKANIGAGVYSGGIAPNVLSRLLPMRPAKYEGFNREEARLYALAIQYAFKQNAVPFFRLDNSAISSSAARAGLGFSAVSNGRTVRKFDTQEEANAFAEERTANGKPTEVRGGPLSLAVVVKFADKIDRAAAENMLSQYNEINPNGGFTKISPTEVVFVNFRGNDGIPFGGTDSQFAGQLDQFVRGINETHAVAEVTTSYAEAEYSEDGSEHDWSRDPSGQSLLQRLEASGRPDLLDWVDDRRKSFDRLVEQYSREYNEQRSRDIQQQRQGGSGPVDPFFSTRFSMRRGMRGVKDRAVLELFDRYDELRRYGEQYRATLPDNDLPDLSNPYLGARTLTGRLAAQQQNAERRYAEILRDMAQNGISLEDMDDFLTAQHALNGGNAHIAAIGGPADGGTGMTNAEAQRVIDDAVISGRFGQMDRLASDWRGMLQEGLRMRRDSGLITQDMYNTLTTRYTHYVPLRGAPNRPFDELFEDWDGNAVSSQGLRTRSRGMPRRLGRRSRAMGVTSQVGFVHEDTMRRVARNEVGMRFLRLVLGVNDVGMAEVIRLTDRQRNTWHQDKRNFGLYASEPMTINGHTYDRGDLVVIRINNPTLASAMATGNIEMRWFERALRDVGNVFRFMTTGMGNPAFFPVNLFRDLGTATLSNLGTRGVRDTAEMLSYWPRSFGRVFMDSWRGRPTGVYEEFVNSGASQDYWRANDLEVKRAEFNDLYERVLRRDPNDRSIARRMLGWYSAAFDAAETASRLAAFQQARARGATDEQAALEARDITVDFGKGGRVKPVANTWYMYLNAGLQGTANVVRTVGRAAALAPSLMMLGYVASTMARFGGGEDEETGQSMWDNVASYDKSSNFIIMDPTGSGRMIKVPLPYGYNAFYSAGVRLADAQYGMDTIGEASTKILLDFLNAFNPWGGSGITGGAASITSQMLPTMIRPFAEMAANENFAGRPIYKEQFSRLKAPDSTEWFDGTPEAYTSTAQWLNEVTGGDQFEAGAIDISPNTIQYLLGYYMSGTGRLVDKTMQVASGDFTASDVPIARSFVGNAATDRRAINERYYGMEQALAPTSRRMEAIRDVNEDPARRMAALENIELDRVAAVEAQKETDKQLKRIREMMKVATPEVRKNLMGIRTSLMKQFIRRMNELTAEE